MQNVITGPWTTPPVRKPEAAMTSAERTTFRAWENWLVSTLVTVRRAGSEKLCWGVPTSTAETLLESQFARAGAAAAAQEMAAELARSMPPVPKVWPDAYSLEFARDAMAAVGIEPNLH